MQSHHTTSTATGSAIKAIISYQCIAVSVGAWRTIKRTLSDAL